MNMEKATTSWENGQEVKCAFCLTAAQPSESEEFEDEVMHKGCIDQLLANREWFNCQEGEI